MRSAVVSIFLFCLWAVIAFVVRCHNVRDVFIDGRIYFVDADCYSRMTRARMVEEHPGTRIRHQDFENYPRGVDSHATAPMDYLIVLLKKGVDGVLCVMDPGGTSVLRSQTLDVAGALVSPLLGALTCGFLALYARRVLAQKPPLAWAVPFFAAVSPILVHGTLLGRPDHQSLQIALLAVALASECQMALLPSRRWAIAGGLAWALALWVSLYEPSILFLLVIALWLCFRPRALAAPERLPGWIAFGIVLAVALLVEGWPVRMPDPEMREYLKNWGSTIGELSSLDLRGATLLRWLGAVCLASPALLAAAWFRDRRALPVGIVLLAVFLLTWWQIRWGYFLALVFAITLPWQYAAMRRWWIALPVTLASLWPMLSEWEARLYPRPEVQAQAHLELKLLRDIADHLRSSEQAAFLAPWWTSPALAYWSGQPGVAGSSHESISGTVDSARFYLAENAAEAAAILRKRQVRQVVVDDPTRVVDVSTTILGISAPPNPIAKRLAEAPHNTASYLVPTFANQFFRIFAVDEAKLSSATP